MSIRLNLASIFVVMLLCFTSAHAQQNAPTTDDVLQMMSTKLSLTDAQKSTIAPVIADRRERLKALRDDGAPMRAHRREAKSIIVDGDKKINAVLSADQQTQYAELERQLLERLRQRTNSP